MADNSPTTALEELQSRFPHIYDVYNEKTVLYALLDIYAKNHEYKLGLIDRLYSALGIEDTYDEDLEWRWGSLLNLYRHPNESYSDYRSRLEIVYPSLVGGTAEAIKYAVATAIGLTSDSDVIDQYIHVYDAWEYEGEIIDDGSSHDTYEPTTNTNLALNDGFKTNLPYNLKKYGAFVVTVDLSISETIADYQKAVTEAVMNTKASGTQPYIIYLYVFYDSAVIKNNGDDVDMMNINDTKYEDVILAVDDELLPEVLTVSYNEIVGLLADDDVLSHIKQVLSENTGIHTDDQIVDNIDLQNDEDASIIGLNRFFIPMLNNSAKLNQSFILSLVDSVDDVDTFEDNIKLQQDDIVGIDGSDEYNDAFSILQDEISNLESEIDDMLDIIQNIQDTTSVDGDDNLTDNISSSILQTGAINSAVIQSMWSSNCINGSVTLNGSFITNQHEEADVCIDRIYYNN